MLGIKKHGTAIWLVSCATLLYIVNIKIDSQILNFVILLNIALILIYLISGIKSGSKNQKTSQPTNQPLITAEKKQKSSKGKQKLFKKDKTSKEETMANPQNPNKKRLRNMEVD